MFDAVDVTNLTVHVLDPRGLDTASLTASWSGQGGNAVTAASSRRRSNMISQGNLAVLPDRTGGRTVKNTNEPAALVSEILQESASYYLLGFEPASRADGRRHEIRVRVNRRGVTVRARTAYVGDSPPGRDAPPDGAAASTKGTVPQRNGLTLTVAATVLAAPAASDPVVALATAVRHDHAPEPLVSVDVVTNVLKMTGEVVGTLSQTIEVSASEGRETAPAYKFLQGLSLAPGRYQVRIGVRNAKRNQSGSVHAFVDVPDFKRLTLFVSDVAFHTEGALLASSVTSRIGRWSS